MQSLVRTCVSSPKSVAFLGVAAAYFAVSSFSTSPTMAANGVDFHKLSTETKIKTLPGSNEIPAKELWEKTGAVIQIVRRPG